MLFTRRSVPSALVFCCLVTAASLPVPTYGGMGSDYALLIDNTGTMGYRRRAAATIEAVGRLVDPLEPGDRLSAFSYGETPAAVLPSYSIEIGDAATKERIKKGLVFGFDADRADITAGLELVWSETDRIFPQHQTPRWGGGTAHHVEDPCELPDLRVAILRAADAERRAGSTGPRDAAQARSAPSNGTLERGHDSTEEGH